MISAGHLPDHPSQFEPLIPAGRLFESLCEEASEVCRGILHAGASTETTATLRELVRSMNSYYSNRIEGQSTSPLNIEAALKKQFSHRPDIARLQALAVAHIETERELEQLVANRPDLAPLAPSFLLSAHRKLLEKLPSETLPNAPDEPDQGRIQAAPGALRHREVVVGRHLPPAFESLPRFLRRCEEVYCRLMSPEARLVAIACAHHRYAWVHPFEDGNGRAVRLQTHAALLPYTRGLWSVNRGLARGRDEYYARLANADAPRRGDLDGRGNLTEQGLAEWVRYFLATCLDQQRFMGRLLDVPGVKSRLQQLVTLRSGTAAADQSLRSEATLPLFHVFAAGPLTRGEFSQMTGLGERTARKLLANLLRQGLLVSDTPHGPVRLGLPLDSLHILFPQLYPEALQS